MTRVRITDPVLLPSGCQIVTIRLLPFLAEMVVDMAMRNAKECVACGNDALAQDWAFIAARIRVSIDNPDRSAIQAALELGASVPGAELEDV